MHSAVFGILEICLRNQILFMSRTELYQSSGVDQRAPQAVFDEWMKGNQVGAFFYIFVVCYMVPFCAFGDTRRVDKPALMSIFTRFSPTVHSRQFKTR
jgi:hypothetical protein